MFSRQSTSTANPTTAAASTMVAADPGLDEFAASVVQAALGQIESVGHLVPFVLIDRGGASTAHPLTGQSVQGQELASLLEVTRSGLRSLGREVNRYALVWPGKVVDGGPVDAVFLECAAQGLSAARVIAVCHWRDPDDGELTTDMELRPLGSAPVRPNWS